MCWLPRLAFSWCVCQLQALSCLPFLESLHRCYIWQMFWKKGNQTAVMNSNRYTYLTAHAAGETCQSDHLKCTINLFPWQYTLRWGQLLPISCSRLTKIGKPHLPVLQSHPLCMTCFSQYQSCAIRQLMIMGDGFFMQKKMVIRLALSMPVARSYVLLMCLTHTNVWESLGKPFSCM